MVDPFLNRRLAEGDEPGEVGSHVSPTRPDNNNMTLCTSPRHIGFRKAVGASVRPHGRNTLKTLIRFLLDRVNRS